jgi:hypothetical protein
LSSNSSAPTIEFSTPEGASHQFSEDYILLCTGRRSFCYARNFTLGQQVPVVYDPARPERAFVHDWALTATVITVFLEAGIGLLFLLALAALLSKGAIRASVRLGPGSPE